ncbi:glycosyltransferase family protein [Nonlabens sp.]|uniref:glycosyltransferase family protein n=1 Tax=Nonlabens sp. TaxID=1888209 RepID=UPI001BCD4C3B|nr:glycosyltransferase family protein [Nonlabens sp.]
MKVLYAIQGTGNGHLSRAKEILPALMNRVQVDVMISGLKADIALPFPIKYNYDGLSFVYGKNGGVDFIQTLRKNNLGKAIQEIRECPVQEYDLIINDFEFVSAWASKIKGVKCISLSHQAALRSKKVPKPKHQDWIGNVVLNYYAPCDDYFGFHFFRYDKNIFLPIIRHEIRNHEISTQGHVTVYLPAYSDQKIVQVLSKIKEVEWQVFSKHTLESYQNENIKMEPVNAERFISSMATSNGVLCGAGFETPAEALFLLKKLMVIPMKGQVEQHFNAEALKQMGVAVINKLSNKNIEKIQEWVNRGKIISRDFPDQAQVIVDDLLGHYLNLKFTDSENNLEFSVRNQ